jgi:hypothetical protein
MGTIDKQLCECRSAMHPNSNSYLSCSAGQTQHTDASVSLSSALSHVLMQVRLLVWDDRSSTSVPVLKSMLTGVMGTYDEQLREWVAQNAPGVQLALVAREGDGKQSVFEGLTASACFSHHQVCPLFCV